MRLSPGTPFYLAAVLSILFAWSIIGTAQAAAACPQLPPGLVGWWPADGHARDMIGNNDGMLESGTTFSAGMVGQAFSFDPVLNSCVEAPGTDIDDLQQLTIHAWVKHNSLGAGVQRYVTLHGEKAVLRSEGNKLHFYMRIESGLYHLRVGEVLGVETWHHVAGTFDGGVMRLYCDGEEVGSRTISGVVDPGHGVQFSSYETLDGFLDEVEIYNRALSASEIRTLYNAGSDCKCNALITEQWHCGLDSGQGENNLTFIEEEDASITVDGSWVYSYSGSDIRGSFIYGTATISGTSFSFTATGSAHNPGAPWGYRDSDFTLNVNTTIDKGAASGTYILTFSNPYWPPGFSGDVQGTRTHGAALTEPLFDTDEDGMPDRWEVQYGLDPIRDDASEDCDRDGFSNLVEYMQGTAPNDPRSHPPGEFYLILNNGGSAAVIYLD